MSKPPIDKTADDGQPREDIPDDERTRPLRARRPTVAPPPAPAAIRPKAPPSVPHRQADGSGDAAHATVDPKLKRRPTMAPPPAPTAIRPQAPPMAPSSAPVAPADSAPTRKQRRPTMAPPPAAGSIRPTAPPTAPVATPRQNLFDDEPADDDAISSSLLDNLSQPAHRLLEAVAGCVPVDSSFDFSQRITDHLVTYWEAQRDHLITDEDGALEKDYAAALRTAKSIIVGSTSDDMENLVEEAKAISDELDATSIGYYARNLPANELRVVQSFHDLAVALMFYKVSFHVEDSADRQVMLASSMGAQGSLDGALDWFAGLPLPEVINTYAGVLKFKIETETRREPR